MTHSGPVVPGRTRPPGSNQVRTRASDPAPGPAATVNGNEAEVAAAFADTYRMLNNRNGIFVNLPFAPLDKLTLQKRLDEIGERKPDESA